MLIVSIMLSIATIGALCGLLFTLSTLALPLLFAVPAFLWAEHAGAGLAGGIGVGAVVAVLALFAGQVSVQLIRPTWRAWQLPSPSSPLLASPATMPPTASSCI